MPIYENDGEKFETDSDTYYEAVASQEEIYREETEEELRAILVFDDPAPLDAVDVRLNHAAEELITGDSDDPPLSEDAIVSMLSTQLNI